MKKHLLLFTTLFVFTLSFCYAQNPLLWGLSVMGGYDTYGNIFSYQSTALWGNDYSFNPGVSGYAPWGSLVLANNGMLYGMTKSGGAHELGTIFSYNVYTGIENDVHDFSGSADGDGSVPEGSFIQAKNGLLYAMTTGGGANNMGAIISFNTVTDSEKVLYSFTGGTADGDYPYGDLFQAGNGLLYGMTGQGGLNDSGIIFSFNISNATEIKLHDFANGTGGFPFGSLMQAKDSLFYGMTRAGGIDGYGVLFSFNLKTNKDSVLHNFGGYPIKDGGNPSGSLIQATDGNLYGLTGGGGTKGAGTIFKFDIATDSETILYDFYSVTMDGEYPAGSLLQASDGILYGYTSAGGSDNDGILFSFNLADSTYTNVYNFTGINAWQPNFGALIEDDTSSNTTGVKEFKVPGSGFQVYPNPSSGSFTIATSVGLNNAVVEIDNMLGEKVLDTRLKTQDSRPLTLDLSGEPAGVYFIYLKSDEGVEVGKVVKN